MRTNLFWFALGEAKGFLMPNPDDVGMSAFQLFFLACQQRQQEVETLQQQLTVQMETALRTQNWEEATVAVKAGADVRTSMLDAGGFSQTVLTFIPLTDQLLRLGDIYTSAMPPADLAAQWELANALLERGVVVRAEPTTENLLMQRRREMFISLDVNVTRFISRAGWWNPDDYFLTRALVRLERSDPYEHAIVRVLLGVETGQDAKLAVFGRLGVGEQLTKGHFKAFVNILKKAGADTPARRASARRKLLLLFPNDGAAAESVIQEYEDDRVREELDDRARIQRQQAIKENQEAIKKLRDAREEGEEELKRLAAQRERLAREREEQPGAKSNEGQQVQRLKERLQEEQEALLRRVQRPSLTEEQLDEEVRRILSEFESGVAVNREEAARRQRESRRGIYRDQVFLFYQNGDASVRAIMKKRQQEEIDDPASSEDDKRFARDVLATYDLLETSGELQRARSVTDARILALMTAVNEWERRNAERLRAGGSRLPPLSPFQETLRRLNDRLQKPADEEGNLQDEAVVAYRRIQSALDGVTSVADGALPDAGSSSSSGMADRFLRRAMGVAKVGRKLVQRALITREKTPFSAGMDRDLVCFAKFLDGLVMVEFEPLDDTYRVLARPSPTAEMRQLKLPDDVLPSRVVVASVGGRSFAIVTGFVSAATLVAVDLDEMRVVKRLVEQENIGAVTSLTASEGGFAAALGFDNGAAVLYDARTLLKLRTLPADPVNRRQVTSVSLDAESGLVAAATGIVQVYKTVDGARTVMLHEPGSMQQVVALAVRRDLVVTGDDGGAVRAWSLSSGQVMMVMRGHRSPLTDLAVTSTPLPIVASVSARDGELRMWSLDDAAPLAIVDDALPPGEAGVDVAISTAERIIYLARRGDRQVGTFLY